MRRGVSCRRYRLRNTHAQLLRILAELLPGPRRHRNPLLAALPEGPRAPLSRKEYLGRTGRLWQRLDGVQSGVDTRTIAQRVPECAHVDCDDGAVLPVSLAVRRTGMKLRDDRVLDQDARQTLDHQ